MQDLHEPPRAVARPSPSTPTTSQIGLTSDEAQRRFTQYGPNEPIPKNQRSLLAELGLQFANPLVAILILASVVSAFVGELADTVIILLIVLVSVALNFFQTFRSQRAADALRATVAPLATVLRDGAVRDIPRREVVPGDIVHLSAGDLVPADARLLEARDLHVQQAALTGESMPVEKRANDAGEASHVLLGSSVVSGTGSAEVLATGRSTQFGDIATRLRARPPETEFDRGLKQFSALITRAVFGLVLFILVVRIGLQRSAFESLLFAVALAVGLTPEFLPMITSVTLARGAVAMAKREVIVKHLSAIQNLGSIDILCSDKTGTITRGRMAVASSCDALGNESAASLFFARLNAKFETGIRSPLDAALLELPEAEGAGAYHKLDEIPFDFERRRLSIVVERAEERWLISKGAPEGLLPLAVAHRVGDREEPLSDELRARCRAAYEALSRRGLRVLAVAVRRVPAQASYEAADERELVLLGFVAFEDPPLASAGAALAALARDGVRVVILTGDNELVTSHVCGEVGLDAAQLVLGQELESMTDSALAQVAEHTSVFARLSPAQKNRVILALKHRSHVVGYLGDGINDAPSLHAADVGISVAAAVDVARDAADIILLKEGLDVLHSGILEGRRAFGNVMKYLRMGTSSNFGNMFSMAGASVLLPFLPMLPTQVLLNNLLYDLAQITIPSDTVDAEVTAAPQRWDIRALRNFMLLVGPISSLYDFLTFFVLRRIFAAGEALFHTGWFVESLATQALVLFVIRTSRSPLQSRPSLPLTLTTLGSVALAIALPFTPLAPVLGFVTLPATYFLFLVPATLAYLALVAAVQRVLSRTARVKPLASTPIA